MLSMRQPGGSVDVEPHTTDLGPPQKVAFRKGNPRLFQIDLYGCWTKNRGETPKMVKIMENPIKMDDLGVPLCLETPKST